MEVVGLDQYLLTWLGVAVPYLQGSMITITAVSVAVGLFVKLTPNKKDDAIWARVKAAFSVLLSSKTPAEALANITTGVQEVVEDLKDDSKEDSGTGDSAGKV